MATEHPYRTPAPAPCTPRPTWRRRLAATLLPARWRCGRAARGGHWCSVDTHRGREWRRAHSYPPREVAGCAHCLACFVFEEHDACESAPRIGTLPCEDHGPPVAPLRWTWPRAPRLGLWWGPVGMLGLVALWSAGARYFERGGAWRVLGMALFVASLLWTGVVARRAERER